MKLSKNPDRSELREYFETECNPPVDCHRNYGDANPDAHGGHWVTYDPERGHFEGIGTFHAHEMGFDVDPEADAQWVYHGEIYLSDVFTEDGEFTDRAQRTADSLHRCPGPAGLVVDGRLTWFVGAMLDERRESYSHYDDSVYEGEYTEILDTLGVNPCNGE